MNICKNPKSITPPANYLHPSLSPAPTKPLPNPPQSPIFPEMIVSFVTWLSFLGYLTKIWASQWQSQPLGHANSLECWQKDEFFAQESSKSQLDLGIFMKWHHTKFFRSLLISKFFSNFHIQNVTIRGWFSHGDFHTEAPREDWNFITDWCAVIVPLWLCTRMELQSNN